MLALIEARAADFVALQTAAAWNGYLVPAGGLAPPEVLQMMVPWVARLQQAQGWGAWFAVCDGEVVASLAIKDPIWAGSVEIGYGTAPQRQGRGHATVAVQALLRVLPGFGVTHVTAQSARDNPASARVLHKAGFAVTGARMDPEDGLLDLWKRRVP